MSKWIGAIAGNVESLLDKVDQAAGSALHKELSEENAKGNAPSRTLSQWQPPPAVLTVSSTTYSPFLSAKNGSTTPDKPDSVPRSGVRVSSSTPSKLDATVVCFYVYQFTFCNYVHFRLCIIAQTYIFVCMFLNIMLINVHCEMCKLIKWT